MYQNFNGGWLVHLYFKTHNEARWIWSVLCSPHSRNTPQTVLKRVHNANARVSITSKAWRLDTEDTRYTGWTFLRASSSILQSQFIAVWMAWHQSTFPYCVSQSHRTDQAIVCDRHIVVN